jgi:hypothetical protein
MDGGRSEMIDKIKQLLQGEKIDATGLAFAHISIATEKAELPGDVWKAVSDFAPLQGWLCLTDRVIHFCEPSGMPGDNVGIILSGELANGNESLHIRQSEGGWLLTRLIAGRGDDCIVFREQFVSTESGRRDRLNYEVYWRLENGAYKPYAGRFCGIGEGKDK